MLVLCWSALPRSCLHRLARGVQCGLLAFRQQEVLATSHGLDARPGALRIKHLAIQNAAQVNLAPDRLEEFCLCIQALYGLSHLCQIILPSQTIYLLQTGLSPLVKDI